VATHDYNLANATGAAFRSDLNNALSAVASNNSSSSDPATTFAFQWYVDTGDNTLKIRNAANDAYINVSTVGGIGSANFGLAPLASPTFTGNVIISSTTALRVPVGTTTQRNAYSGVANGDIRYNSSSSTFEGYAGGAWGAIGGGATGGGGDSVFYENSLTVTTSYSISANSGAHAVGPLVINSGVTVTVPATSHLVIS
jgi:hypothetical protein